ncbi:MAG: 3D domain-containing protein [Vicinamibacterales bacterium]
MRIAESYWRKAIATFGVAAAFVFLYQTTARDSRSSASEASLVETAVLPQAGSRMQFTATAYCKGETTASGVGVRTGVAAADPALLPVGSVVRLETPNPRYSGVWTVMDTGPAVRGRTVDLYLWSCKEALVFGRRPVRLTVLRLGWNPQNSIPGMVDSLFRKREADSKKPAEPVVPAIPSATTTVPSADGPR